MPSGTSWPGRNHAGNDRHAEARHELVAALFGIEACAHGLNGGWTELTSGQINQLTTTMVDEVRRVRALLEGRAGDARVFELATAIAPALVAARASGQLVTSDVPSGIRVHGCPDAARQVLVALLDNARRHAGGSPVELVATQHNDVVRLLVKDRGPGIPPRLRARVFERGVRRSAGSGSGLGLFIARRLMNEDGGSIKARRRRGGGITFVLRFPGRAPR